MINSSKISIHRFIATTLFRVVKEWPHSSGNIHEYIYIYIYIYITNCSIYIYICTMYEGWQ